jgi:hypothetical protein
VEPGRPAERGDDRRVEASGADGGVGLVDDGVPAGVQRGDGGAGGDGLARPDLAGDHPDGALGDQPGDAGDGFGVAVVAVEHRRGEGTPEWGSGEAVVGA